MASRTGGQYSFAVAPTANIPRSVINRNCGLKTAFKFGELVPVFWDELLPGDTINLGSTLFGRLVTQKVPVMDNMYLDVQYWVVPLRLLWDNFQKFMGERKDPGDSIDYLVPTAVAPAGGWAEESLQDYLGIPPGIEGLEHAVWFERAYTLIWNEWYRDQDLQDSLALSTGDGPDTTSYTLQKRGKRHDYFTSCRPSPQKGDPVTIGIGASAPVTGSLVSPTVTISSIGQFTTDRGGMTAGPSPFNVSVTSQGPMQYTSGLSAVNANDAITGTADLSAATAITINQLRFASSLQRILERDMRGGTRYVELLKSFFRVTSPDQRLQRPEYVGGTTVSLNVQSVPNTTGISPAAQADLAAYATLGGKSRSVVYSATEHCVILGLASARADLNYQQGLDRMFDRRTRYDFYWPQFANLGEQAVLNREIYAQGPTAPGDPDADVFGYQERWAEYRYKPSKVTGKMRSSAAQSLDIWHLSQDFGSLPTLSGQFIQEDPPIGRILTVPAEPHIKLDGFFTYRHVRPMPLYSVPALMDRF